MYNKYVENFRNLKYKVFNGNYEFLPVQNERILRGLSEYLRVDFRNDVSDMKFEQFLAFM